MRSPTTTTRQYLGLQSLVLAVEGNPYDVGPGWGFIGTHVSPRAHRQGVGKALFDVTRQAGERAGLAPIDATIGADNTSGLAYCSAMGFRDYEVNERVRRKRYDYE